MKNEGKIGVIGGTGLVKNMNGFNIRREGWYHTGYWGEVWVVEGEIAGREVVFIPRHGLGHRYPPHKVNYLGNLIALKKKGVCCVYAASAMGALDTKYAPGQLVFVDVVTNRTEGRQRTFFNDGIACHVAVPRAVCPHLHQRLVAVAGRLGIPYQSRGNLVVISGPQFSSIQQSRIHRAEGHHVVGMTSSPESDMAKDLQLHYAIVGQSTDWDNPPSGIVSERVDQNVISRRLKEMSSMAARVICEVIASSVPQRRTRCGCLQALNGAILTAPGDVGPEARLQIRSAFGLDKIPGKWFANS